MSFEYLHKFSTVEQRFVQNRTMEQNETFDNISNQIAECWFLIFRPTKTAKVEGADSIFALFLIKF